MASEDTDPRPVLDSAELNDVHYKMYVSKSMKRAIEDFAKREDIPLSEAGRVLMLRAFSDPGVFGGYRVINSLARMPGR